MGPQERRALLDIALAFAAMAVSVIVTATVLDAARAMHAILRGHGDLAVLLWPTTCLGGWIALVGVGIILWAETITRLRS